MALQDQDRQVRRNHKYLQMMFGKDSAWFQKWNRQTCRADGSTVNKVRFDFALLNHAQAQAFRAAGDEQSARSTKAAKVQILLKGDMEAPNAYNLAWTLAEVLFFAGKRCDALRTKPPECAAAHQGPQDGRGRRPHRTPTTSRATESSRRARGDLKSVNYYQLVRDWKGQKTRDAEGKPMDFHPTGGNRRCWRRASCSTRAPRTR